MPGFPAETAVAGNHVVLAAVPVTLGRRRHRGELDRGLRTLWWHDDDQPTGDGLKWVGISSFPDESDNGDGNAPGSYRGNVRRVDSTRSSNALTALVASMGMSRTRMLRTTIRLQVSPSCVAIVNA